MVRTVFLSFKTLLIVMIVRENLPISYTANELVSGKYYSRYDGKFVQVRISYTISTNLTAQFRLTMTCLPAVSVPVIFSSILAVGMSFLEVVGCSDYAL